MNEKELSLFELPLFKYKWLRIIMIIPLLLLGITIYLIYLTAVGKFSLLYLAVWFFIVFGAILIPAPRVRTKMILGEPSKVVIEFYVRWVCILSIVGVFGFVAFYFFKVPLDVVVSAAIPIMICIMIVQGVSELRKEMKTNCKSGVAHDDGGCPDTLPGCMGYYGFRKMWCELCSVRVLCSQSSDTHQEFKDEDE
ncbi:MAG: hypothetical protein QME59_07105 [Candidatus Hydrothermarchaeota archaeon]|nr:hypothetical protein [Candidatus Hydrothermarchaeota archaeon]